MVCRVGGLEAVTDGERGILRPCLTVSALSGFVLTPLCTLPCLVPSFTIFLEVYSVSSESHVELFMGP